MSLICDLSNVSSGLSFAASVVLKSILGRASDLFGLILRFSFLPTQNAKDTSTTAWSHQNLPGQQSTVNNIRRILLLKPQRRGAEPPRSPTQGLLLVPHWKSSRRKDLKSQKFVMLLVKLPCVKSRRESRKPRMKRRQRKLKWWPKQRQLLRVTCPKALLARVLNLEEAVGRDNFFSVFELPCFYFLFNV